MPSTSHGSHSVAAAQNGASTTLDVIAPAIPRENVESTGRVGAIAYPYRVVAASVRMTRPLVHDREDEFVVSVDRSRRLAVRADAFPEVEPRQLDDVLELPAELTPEQADARARKSVFEWTLRRYSLNTAPDITFDRAVDAYKLFWLAERPDGDVIIDSVRGDEAPLVE